MHASHWGTSEWVQLAIVLMCLALSAFASRSETALTALNRVRARHLLERRLPGSQVVLDLLEQPNQFLSAILILNTIVIVVASTLGTNLATTALGDVWGTLAASGGISLVVLAFCELIPKTMALHTAERTALRVAPLVRMLTVALRPLIAFFGLITSLTLRMRGIRDYSGPFLTEAELMTMVTVGEEQGVLEEGETEMIQNVFTFEETPTHKVMVPRTEMTAVDADLTLTQAIDIALQENHSRLPLYDGDLDHVIGIIYLKDMLRELRHNNTSIALRSIARPPMLVPATKHIGELLRDFQAQNVHIAMVVDEYGGTDGLVTIEDLLEEIVGEIRDEHDIGEIEEIQHMGHGEYVLDGLANIDEVLAELHLHVETGDFDTLGGFLIDRLGRIPSPGDSIDVEDIHLTVEAMDDLRVATVRAVRQQSTPPPASGE